VLAQTCKKIKFNFSELSNKQSVLGRLGGQPLTHSPPAIFWFFTNFQKSIENSIQ
jgi:hypothetical protein